MCDLTQAAAALDGLCPKAVRILLDRFEEAGVGAYPVGGCVRDALMGRVPHDWDMAVSCPPEETVALCETAGFRVIPTGIAHGTVTVLVPETDGATLPIECTTCRTEGGYSDGRHPDRVCFSERIEDDLSRRDFTVNAMAAARDRTGHFRVLDLFGGLDDLSNGIIRCVGDPETRLREDALRVLRGVRFSVRFGFKPEAGTRAALISCGSGLLRISGERVREELRGILTSPDPDRGVLLLQELELLPYVVPYPSPDTAGLARRGGFSSLDGFESRLAAMLWGIPGSELTADVHRLRLSGAETRRVCARLSAADWKFNPTMPMSELARRLRARLGEEALPALSVRQVCDPLPPGFSGLADAVRHSVDACEPVTLGELALGGHDLSALGVPAGVETGRMLAQLLDEVLRDPSRNTPETLAETVRVCVQAHDRFGGGNV